MKADTVLLDLYNHFNDDLQTYRLMGKNSADYYYLKMDSFFHNSQLTNMAKDMLSSRFIQSCQEKINLYLEEKDNSNDVSLAQKEYAGIGNRFGFMKERSLQLQADFSTSFGEVAQMLENTISLQSMDSNLTALLLPKIFFLFERLLSAGGKYK